MKELIEAGVHFGHQTSRWNPKMKRFIFGEKSGVYIVDLEKTVKGLTEAREFLRSVAQQGGSILFVGTKRQAQAIVAEEAVRCGQFYVNLRWLGGLLTNFQTIQKSIQRLKLIREGRKSGALEQMTKKEAARQMTELAKLEKTLSGILEMNQLPKAIYVIDAKREETAVKEAVRLGIPVVGLVDTNSDPDPIEYVIPGNDDSIRSIRLITSRLADAIQEGRQIYLANQAEEQARRAKEEAEKVALEEKEAAAALQRQQATAGDPAAEGAVPVSLVDEVEQIMPKEAIKVEEEGITKRRKVVKAKEETKGEAAKEAGEEP